MSAEIRQQVSLVAGLFFERLPYYQGRDIALLHVDADLYQSYLDVPQHLWPGVRVGGSLAFDEYLEVETLPGARAEVDEFFASVPSRQVSFHTFEQPGYRNYYAVKRSSE